MLFNIFIHDLNVVCILFVLDPGPGAGVSILTLTARKSTIDVRCDSDV